MIVWNGRLLLSTFDYAAVQLWQINEAGLEQVANIDSLAGQYLDSMLASESGVYFTTHASAASPRSPWFTDGTAAGTRPLRNPVNDAILTTSTTSHAEGNRSTLLVHNGTLLFTAGREFWISVGIEARKISRFGELHPYSIDLLAFEDTLHVHGRFSIQSGLSEAVMTIRGSVGPEANSVELYSGMNSVFSVISTTPGKRSFGVFDTIRPAGGGAVPGAIQIFPAYEFCREIHQMRDRHTSQDLSERISDCFPTSSQLHQLTLINGNLAFRATVPLPYSSHPSSIRVIDLTTKLSRTIAQFSLTGEEYSRELVALGNTLLFTEPSVNGIELWRYEIGDMTAAPMMDLYPGTLPNTVTPASSRPHGFFAFDDVVLFAAEDATGVELWRTDGTVGGTYRVKDIHAGNASSSPFGFVRQGSKVYFGPL
jgi:ELWxxDGT repeat protein